MKDLNELNYYRVLDKNYKPKIDGKLFEVKHENTRLRVIADIRGCWEHISVSTITYDRRLPNWYEMKYCKELFFHNEEIVIQIHPKQSEYVNISECLHLWRNWKDPIEGPPRSYVI